MSATPAQRAMIEGLFTQKGVIESVRVATREIMDRVDAQPRKHISPLIDGLLKLPDIATLPPDPDAEEVSTPLIVSTPTAVLPGSGLINKILRENNVPCGKYAIPAAQLPPLIRDAYTPLDDHLLVVVDEFKETRYVRQLTGTPGHFTRGHFDSLAERTDIVRVIITLGVQASRDLFDTLFPSPKGHSTR